MLQEATLTTRSLISRQSLQTFIQESIEPGSTIVSDGRRGYYSLEAIGYKHKTETKGNETETLPHVHLVISLIKRWIMGTPQGSWELCKNKMRCILF
jgi:hypothetical protein